MESCFGAGILSRSSALVAWRRAAVILLVGPLLVCLAARPAAAVIISSGNGQTGVDPSNPLTANVGISSTGGASVTYLGNDWAITADHVNTNTGGVGPLQIGGNDYSVDETIQLTNPQDDSLADLKVVHIVTGGANPPAPVLPNLQIASSSLGLGATVEMVGNGQSLNVDESGSPVQYYWNATGPDNNLTWTQVSASMADPQPGNASGYVTTDTNTIRYGENDVSNVTGASPVYDGSSYTVTAFTTTFNDSYYSPSATLYSDEAQATLGDSGGAVFSFVDGQWQLVGIMVAEATYSNQPSNVSPSLGDAAGTAVFGDESYIADLSVYRSQIVAVVPEPSSLLMAALGGLGLLLAAVRRRLRAVGRA
ncbi:MAG TPA: PEP-CTERM sorting domain-containing protein [Pirellulales bacterium]|nr:PEP-CTERM sorting domain-containing protein [Pirellulales bacterium]